MSASPIEVSITTLPTELIFLILSFLPPKAYKAFSRISKACRRASIPFVFRQLRLFPDNIHLWQKNPNICVAARRLSLYALHSRHEADLMDHWRICTNAVGLFPNVTGLKLLYESSSWYLQRRDPGARTSLDNKLLQFDNRLFNAIFSTLSTFPFYHSQLKKLHIEIDKFYSTREEYPLNISAENREFLNSANKVITENGLGGVPFPQGIEEAVLTGRTVFFTPPGYNLSSFTALQHCQDSLKSFTILGTPEDLMYFPNNSLRRPKDAYIKAPILNLDISDSVYPNVTVLCVGGAFTTNDFFYELPARFPRVRELRLHDSSATLGLKITEQLEEVTSMLRAFEELKVAVLPWPLKEVDRDDWDSPDWDPVPPVSIDEIEATVRFWLADSRLGQLNRVAFWSWDNIGSTNYYGDAVILGIRKGRRGEFEFDTKKIRCYTKEELFPILGKGWEPVCWIDYSKRRPREGLVIGL
ncbi:hypothetical protein TWF281_009007 [Arthrobotrys megalospora]